MKAGRNKTIDTDLADGAEYLARCLRLSAPAAAEEVRVLRRAEQEARAKTAETVAVDTEAAAAVWAWRVATLIIRLEAVRVVTV